ncbi:hypothetical protein FACS1894206_07520 [Deltaproteobacteria bacterium]|nr:hypothetical protein FACS1894206_07520 [Deltaproteobacteria bacterium]
MVRANFFRVVLWLITGFIPASAGLFLLPPSLLARGLPSPPDAVTFFAREAQVGVAETLRPEAEDRAAGEVKYVVRIPLPIGMIKESFSVAINEENVASFYWEKKTRLSPPAVLPEAEKDAERKKLLSAFAVIKEEAARLNGEKHAFESRLALWKSLPAQNKRGNPNTEKEGASASSDEAVKIDALLGERIPALEAGLQKCEANLAQNKQRLDEAFRVLQWYDRARGGETAIVPVKQAGEVRARYRYTLPAGNVLHYRVNARPEKGILDVTSLAELTQNSGIDWSGADVSLALVARSPYLFPPVPDPWIVDYAREEAAPRSRVQAGYAERRMAEPMAVVEADEADEIEERLAAREPEQAEQVEMATFRLWKLGKRDIKHDAPLTVQLAEDSFKADFYYTVRPMSDHRGFLTAELAFAAPIEMPVGQADCFVDDSFIGTDNLRIAGEKATLYLGADPMITATMRDLADTRGEQGFLSKSQTKTRHWNITVKNARSRAVDVRVEEPAPVSRDESITIKSAAKPTSEMMTPEEASFHPSLRWNVWKKKLAPGENFVIDWQVTLEAPTGKILNPGR